jgi:hypothetical protein
MRSWTVSLAMLLGCNAILGSNDYRVGLGGDGQGGGASSQGAGPPNGGGGAGANGGGASGPGGAGGEGGVGGNPCDVPLEDKPVVTIEGEIASDFTLTCDKTYKLTGEVFVQPPAVLTIDAGTTIFGDKTTGAALIIRPGAKIEAIGEADRPIVFTSEGGDFADPGDWGGLVILGNAPINVLDGNGMEVQARVEGIVNEPNAFYGGQDPMDDSGTLAYVRVEYGGKAIAPNNELNGITFAGVGRATEVHHVEVRQTTDDCFEFFGGTVDAKYLICQAPGDDGFDWDFGFTGRLQFLVVQQDVAYPVPQDMNGFEGDNDAAGSGNLPLSEPTIYNVTLCGQDYNAGQQYGALLRKNTRAHIFNAIVSGFEAGVDVRDASGPMLDFEHSVFFGNTRVAYPEDQPSPYGNDDALFDEVAWITTAANMNSLVDPGVAGCDDMMTLDLAPSSPPPGIGVSPPMDGFFDDAPYPGAFADAADDWAAGAWVSWAPN